MCDHHNPPVPMLSVELGRKTRLKIWELEARLICPVIGTCLTTQELRQQAIRLKVPGATDMSDYRLHVGFVSTCEKAGPNGRTLHKALDRKFASAIRRFAPLRDEAELAEAWESALARGEVQGALWALLTHPRTIVFLRDRAYEAVHMLSHQIGAGLRADLKRLADVAGELARMHHDKRRAEHTQAQALAARDHRVRALEAELATLRTHTIRLDEELRAYRADGDHHALRREIDDANRRLQREVRRAERAEHQLASVRDELRRLRAERAGLAAATAGPDVSEPTQANDLVAAEEAPDLGGRTLLCVGGRTRLEAHYQALVERCHGQLLRHDGGMEDNIHRLEALLASADAVICPLDCVSHDAYLRTKRFCKRNGKPCLLVKQSGISAFSRALSEIARGAPDSIRVAGVEAPLAPLPTMA